VDVGGASQAISGRVAIVRGLTLRWDRPGPRSRVASPATEVEIAF